ncbi:MAG: nucleotidyltransferase domain-containing protein [Flavobacteriaceae bacterium]|nr:nucleotidyltransferase domain-containing protein [Flavobacteriaceae bacterium]
MIDIALIKQQIVDALISLNPEKIILFGSYAYGTPTEDSDLDICVIEKDYENKLTETMKIRKLLSGIRISKDVLIQNLEEYNFYRNEINSVFYDIDTKGDVLWQKNY